VGHHDDPTASDDRGDSEEDEGGVRGLVSSIDWDDVAEAFVGSLIAGLVLFLVVRLLRRD
jgi:hypothetical protein